MRPKGPSKEARRASGECRRARRARTAEELARPEGLAGTSGAKRNWSSASEFIKRIGSGNYPRTNAKEPYVGRLT